MRRNMNFANKFENVMIDKKEKKMEFEWIMSTLNENTSKSENGPGNYKSLLNDLIPWVILNK